MALWVPQAASDLYEGASDDVVLVTRPLFQGDVFEGVNPPGLDPDERGLAMLVTHPCSMLNGATYIKRLEVVRVRECPQISFDDWPNRAYELFPLPEFMPGRHFAAFLQERVSIATPVLPVHRLRVLSSDGVKALQQRIAHETSRVVVPMRLLSEAADPIWLEQELQAEWNDRRISIPGIDFSDADSIASLDSDQAIQLVELLQAEAKLFTDFLGRARSLRDETTNYTVRRSLKDELRDPARVNAVRNTMGSYLKQLRSAPQ